MVVALPIPEPRPDDHEDVHWQLSTASALWARGESAEALKWLRRAADKGHAPAQSNLGILLAQRGEKVTLTAILMPRGRASLIAVSRSSSH